MKRLSKSERVHQDDAAWFKAHPHRSHRIRRFNKIELQETVRPATASASSIPYTVVRQVRPGHRLQLSFWSAGELIDTEALGHALFVLLLEPFQHPPEQPTPGVKVGILYRAHDRGAQA
jgi:hypothetical protein